MTEKYLTVPKKKLPGFRLFLSVVFFLFGTFFTLVFLNDLLNKDDRSANIQSKRLFTDSTMNVGLQEASDTSFETQIILLTLFGILPLVLSGLFLFSVVRKSKSIH